MSEYGGRCLKAAKEIDEGELVVAGEPPLVHAINDGAMSASICSSTFAEPDTAPL